MRKRHPNHRLVKIHRSYTVEEIAELFDIHKNTVRTWIKDGLELLDRRRPMLIAGSELVKFLKARRAKHKQSCKHGELYCVKCRTPRPPAADMVEYTPVTERFGNLSAICPVCESIINRRVSIGNLHEIACDLEIAYPEALRHII